MKIMRVGALSDAPLAAAAQFYAEILPQIVLELGQTLCLIFAPADHTHQAWRLAAVQELARQCAPLRVNAIASDDEAAIAAAVAYLGKAAGVTGQLVILDGAGAGDVVFSAL